MTFAQYTTDFVVAGSGGGLAGALAAAEGGLETLVVESSPWIGGSTALSGGTLWLPANRLMLAAGVSDSAEAGAAYLDAIVSEEHVWCARKRRAAFLADSPALVQLLERRGVRLYYADGWTDYYAEAQGGLTRGRTIGAKPFSAARLGEAAAWLRPTKLKLAANSVEVATLALGGRTWKSASTIARVGLRNAWAKANGIELLTRGQSLIAQTLRALLDARVRIWREAPVQKLIFADGRVLGVEVQHAGNTVQVLARHGVLLATGGFARNALLRTAHQPLVGAQWTLASPDDQGDALRLGEQVNAATAALDEAWWVPSTTPPGYTMGHVWDRCFPHSIIVDAHGERYMNEAAPYMEAGQRMLGHARDIGDVRSWLILERRHRDRYAFGMAAPRITPRQWLDSGYLRKADSIEALARCCGMDPQRLARTVLRFNEHAQAGQDPDFHRGENAFARYYGDSRVRPNPNLGVIERPPFYAAAIYPGDVGTAGGMVADEHARVLDRQGQPIEGLYAAGNCAAPVFGRTYPGAGATIAASMVFSMRAARHAATAAASAPASTRGST